MDRDRLCSALRDAGYTALGAGVLGWQRLRQHRAHIDEMGGPGAAARQAVDLGTVTARQVAGSAVRSAQELPQLASAVAVGVRGRVEPVIGQLQTVPIVARAVEAGRSLAIGGGAPAV